jgi:hypothetical protein
MMVRVAVCVWNMGGPRIEDVPADALVRYLRSLPAATTPCIGIELERTPGQQMSIALDGDRWALVVSDLEPDFQQYASVGDERDTTKVEVYWGELDSIPGAWFLDLDNAIAAVEAWLATGERLASITWTGDTSG